MKTWTVTFSMLNSFNADCKKTTVHVQAANIAHARKVAEPYRPACWHTVAVVLDG